MYVRFWGTRGSIPTPGQGTARYGGNTSCVEVRAADGTRIVLDCGTGARALGLHLACSAPQPLRIHLLIGHTHWDHIQGFPFFVPAFLPGAELNVYAPAGFRRSIEEAMSGQMEYSYFPVKLRDLRSRIHFTELDEGFFRVGEVLVETQYLNHTAPTIAYRISSGAVLAYVTDHEPFWAPVRGAYEHPGDQRHIGFLRGADLVIHDAQYSAEEYRNRVGWGHATVDYATDVALAAGAKRLALFHHDPAHDDGAVEHLERVARARAGGALDVFAATEGVELELRGGPGAPVTPTGTSALDRRPIAGGRILVVTANAEQATAIHNVLDADGLTLLTTPDIRTALTRAPEIAPDLAIIDARLPDGDGSALIEPLRSRVGRPALPVVILTEDSGGQAAAPPLAAPVDDFLAKPFSPPMLHTRVRAWLARALVADDRRAGPVEVRRPAPAALDSDTLGDVPIFRALTRDQREALLAQAATREYPAGRVVIAEGQTPEEVFVVLAGRVRVMEAMPDVQTEVVLVDLGEGELFGELAILSDRPRSATVVAVEPTRCLVLRRTEFVQAMERMPALALTVVRMLARRLYDSDRRLARYAPDALTGLASRRAFHDLYRRMAASARRRKAGLLLMVFDVVRLREINDRFGYVVGDEVLRTLADALMEGMRTTDLVARYGADEMVAVLQDAGRRDAEAVVPRVSGKLRELAARRGLPLTPECRVGVAHRDLAPESAEDLLREADDDMRHRGQRIP